MESFVDKKIEDVYNAALLLGVDKASDTEKEIFKHALRNLAMSAVDEARHKINEVLHKESLYYSQK